MRPPKRGRGFYMNQEGPRSTRSHLPAKDELLTRVHGYRCLCGKVFATRDGLRLHQKSKHERVE